MATRASAPTTSVRLSSKTGRIWLKRWAWNAIHTPYQVHSADVVIADDHIGKDRPQADGIVTATSGLAVGIVTADCGPVLLADAAAGVVGACHAGWKGALGGILENTVEAMCSLGAKREAITAVLGPTISAAHYEVGPDFPQPFSDRDADASRFFSPSSKADHHMFDLPAYILWRLETAGITAHALPVCTYEDAEHFFSYRRTTHADEPDYGRQIVRHRLPLRSLRMLFEPAEYTDRMNRTLAAMKAEKLDCLLLFAPESMYWLTGFDTFGYRFFQCLVVQPNGHTTLLTRSADLRQAERTSNIEEVHIWIDSANTNPARNLRDLLAKMDLLGANFGVELDTNALTAYQYRLLEDNLDNFGELTDASSLVHDLRQTKSTAEKLFIREAAAQADRALDAAIDAIKPGVSEGDVLAAMQGSIFRDGGDYPGNPIVIGAGEDALLCRTKSGRNTIAENDQVTLEWAGVAANYHACMMRTLIVGQTQAGSPAPVRRRQGSAVGRRSQNGGGQHVWGPVRRPCPCARPVLVCRTTASMPAATISAHGLRPHGWTAR